MYTFWRAQLALKALEAEDRVLEAATGWDWAGSRSTPEPTLTYFGQWAFSRIIRPSTVHGPSGRRYCRCFVVVITWAAAGVEREGGLLLSRGDQLILGGRVVCRGLLCRGVCHGVPGGVVRVAAAHCVKEKGGCQSSWATHRWVTWPPCFSLSGATFSLQESKLMIKSSRIILSGIGKGNQSQLWQLGHL